MTETAGRTRDAGPQQSSPVRERILAAANEHFYAEGIRAVSADRLIAAAGVSKVTFYRHFPSKDDLVLAYLEGRAAVERQALEQFRDQAGDACDTLLAIARGIADISCSPGFRGCPFINAAAEFADPAHPARRAIAAHRAWFATFLKDLLGEMAIHDRETVADQLIILRDGAMVTGYLGPDPATLTDTLIRAGRAVINDARASTAPPSDTSS
ncbi:TetR family transcriptional regulator [Pseudonocardia hierapolitana]|uniref:TetR family transcriptional regulator n=1 Tax=Pseudonocardia hierapolitana TaxID=1128676 RepID=A0A561T4T3_9PSEU|nr:TetR/AcrR family transcriptional regulator [Pseudonocardia hierapolitana]TWF82102.1 TetR family transcriptional regulator [Pseudonocardia hierapolitana]